MKFQGAVIKEQGVRFAVLVVKKSVINNTIEANKAMQSFRPLFPGMPVVLMGQDQNGRPTYYGRPDLARFLAHVSLNAIPWREYSMD